MCIFVCNFIPIQILAELLILLLHTFRLKIGGSYSIFLIYGFHLETATRRCSVKKVVLKNIAPVPETLFK